jgi:hypothetical protein
MRLPTAPMTLARQSVALIGLALMAGCVQLLQPTDVHRGNFPAPAAGAAPRAGADSALTLGLSRKPVSGKEAPTTLLARDGTRCTVTEKRFNEIVHGEQVTCAWR